LLVEARGRYEAGLFDVRNGEPCATALAGAARDLALRGTTAHPALAEGGWWRKQTRLAYPPVGPAAVT
jgi:dTDP-4-dehydrorhamnose reductase